MMNRMYWMNCLLRVALLLPSVTAFGGSQVTVGARVPAGQLVSVDRIDHARWDALLQRYVDGDGNVAYAKWKQAAADVQALDQYLATLSAASPSRQASAPAKLAFWINAYNAVTIRGILREYPTTSIRNHTAKLFGYNIWDDLLLIVAGKTYSLNAIEHEVLRKMGQPRIHFAIVCASRSCPRLVNRAYTAENIETLLTLNTKAFFANPGNFRYDPASGHFYLSSILEWFGEDFGHDQAAVLRRIAPYLPTAAAVSAAKSGSGSISYLDYDWGLNDQ